MMGLHSCSLKSRSECCFIFADWNWVWLNGKAISNVHHLFLITFFKVFWFVNILPSIMGVNLQYLIELNCTKDEPQLRNYDGWEKYSSFVGVCFGPVWKHLLWFRSKIGRKVLHSYQLLSVCSSVEHRWALLSFSDDKCTEVASDY